MSVDLVIVLDTLCACLLSPLHYSQGRGSITRSACTSESNEEANVNVGGTEGQGGAGRRRRTGALADRRRSRSRVPVVAPGVAR